MAPVLGSSGPSTAQSHDPSNTLLAETRCASSNESHYSNSLHWHCSQRRPTSSHLMSQKWAKTQGHEVRCVILSFESRFYLFFQCYIDYWPEFYISELAQVFFRTTVLSSRDPISIPVMTTNFKGPVFWLQDCSREIMLWKRGSLRTTVWLASWYRMSLPVRFSSQS